MNSITEAGEDTNPAVSVAARMGATQKHRARAAVPALLAHRMRRRGAACSGF